MRVLCYYYIIISFYSIEIDYQNSGEQCKFASGSPVFLKRSIARLTLDGFF